MKALEYISSKQEEWLTNIRPFLLQTNLNVGSGIGFFSEAAKHADFEITSLEVNVHPDTVNKNELVLYDGTEMPFDNKKFDASIAMYVLHHTSNPTLTLTEMKRVSKQRLIIVEELYSNFLGKLCLVITDVLFNRWFKQKSDIHFNSYFSKKQFFNDVETGEWKIVHYASNQQLGFTEALCVVDRVR